MFEFHWDNRKAASNLVKHKITFSEAASIFSDPMATTYPDGEHSHGEPRFLTFGHSVQGRLLVVSHTEAGNSIRIINARRVTRDERKIYEKNQ